jgi:hypothetical protein
MDQIIDNYNIRQRSVLDDSEVLNSESVMSLEAVAAAEYSLNGPFPGIQMSDYFLSIVFSGSCEHVNLKVGADSL